MEWENFVIISVVVLMVLAGFITIAFFGTIIGVNWSDALSREYRDQRKRNNSSSKP